MVAIYWYCDTCGFHQHMVHDAESQPGWGENSQKLKLQELLEWLAIWKGCWLTYWIPFCTGLQNHAPVELFGVNSLVCYGGGLISQEVCGQCRG